MTKDRRAIIILAGMILVLTGAIGSANDFCPELKKAGDQATLFLDGERGAVQLYREADGSTRAKILNQSTHYLRGVTWYWGPVPIADGVNREVTFDYSRDIKSINFATPQQLVLEVRKHEDSKQSSLISRLEMSILAQGVFKIGDCTLKINATRSIHRTGNVIATTQRWYAPALGYFLRNEMRVTYASQPDKGGWEFNQVTRFGEPGLAIAGMDSNPTPPITSTLLGMKVGNEHRSFEPSARHNMLSNGVIVLEIDPSSDAAKKVSQGEMIVEVSGQAVSGVEDFETKVKKLTADTKRVSLLMTVENQSGALRFISLKLK